MKKILLFCHLLVTTAICAQNYGTVSGTIVDSENNPVSFANVFIENLKKGGMADEFGQYTLTEIPYGEWQIKVSSVGFRTIKFALNLSSSQISNLVIKLNMDNALSEVEVFGRRMSHPDKIEALTRLPLEPYEQIQSISVISEKLISNQGALTISEATKNVPGVYTFATYGNKRESMSSRGFRGIPILKNGVRVHSDFRGVGILTDMQGVDNIQVLKGAASITQGVATDLGSPGGVINIVTKTPIYQFGGAVTQRFGSFGQVRPTFDIYGPIDDNQSVAFRINGALERADSFRDGISSERIYINPSLQWKIDDRTKITMEFDYFDDSRTPDVGTVNLAANEVNAIYDLPRDQFLGYENDRSLTKNTTYSLRFDRQLNDKLTLKTAFYKSHLKLNDKGASLGSVVTIDDVEQYNLRARGYSTSTRSDDNGVLQVDLIGDDFKTGNIKHTFQVGFDYRTSKYSTTSQSLSAIDTINVFENNSNTLPNVALTSGDPAAAESKSFGLVAQDVVSWTDWFKTFLGIRYSTTETITDLENNKSDAFSPLGGIIVNPYKNINVFASYTNSAYPRTAARLGVDGEALGNERFDQLEAGVKTSWFTDRLRFNLTLFKINNKNINLPVYDENWVATGFYQKGGNDQRQGLEVELTGRILENLTAVAGYSYIDAQYKEHTSYVYGSAPLNTPKHTANVYLDYKFEGMLEGLSLGGGVYYTGERPINDWSSGAVTHEGIVPNEKPFNVEAYTLTNLQAGYRFNNHWDVRLMANNIFDQIGYNAYRTSYINQTDPRSFAGILRYTL
ncbi:TonB-dependent receptor [Arenibacter sp. F26102]|uniref:TonB-dependent receptor n=1 Tax=Arenibacter sp. F26102 TaxID=2926416 RepID=UPI001FF4B0EC|nr:TonB-dependent receptor [Arenibacter sp. F26102]MCK0144918.1 TonB-dependent receptor [Arenibacter sp. F26102]